MPFLFENLQVYQKVVDFADIVASHTENFPRGYYFLVDQLNRAALSIATNPVEGRLAWRVVKISRTGAEAR
jgi:four helix bundle protein